MMKVGELAKLTGLSPDTMRYYERIGLLPTPVRTAGGFRMYSEAAVKRVRVIQASLHVGFKLTELRQVFAERAAGRPPCREVRALAQQKMDMLDEQIAALTHARRALERTLVEFDERLARSVPARLLETLAERSMGGALLRLATPPKRVRR